jgi:hypothetical protein
MTDVHYEERRLVLVPEDEGTTIFRNFDKYTPVCTA